jgi:hypothetical protein
MADRTKAIIGQCIPVCKARLQRGVAHRCAHAVAVGKPPSAMLDFPKVATALAIIGGSYGDDNEWI